MQEAVSNMVWGLLNPAAKNPWFRTKTPFFQGRFGRGHSTGPDIGRIKQCNDMVIMQKNGPSKCMKFHEVWTFVS